MKRPSLVTVLSVLGLGALAIGVVFASRFGTDPSLSPSPLIGRPAPEITLDLVESDLHLALADLEGQVVVINFWAPWCVPCRTEHADLVAIADGFEGFGVTVIGAAYQSDEDDVIGFLDELGRAYPVGMDDRSRAAIEFGIRGVPETYFVDRDGIVVAKIAGPIDLDLASATLDRIILGNDIVTG